MTELDLAAIRRRAEQATPGPWVLWTGCSWKRIGVNDERLTMVLTPTVNPHDRHPDLIVSDADAEFIIHARTDIPFLLDRLALLEAQTWQPIESAPKGRLFLGGHWHRVYGWLWGTARWHNDAHQDAGGYYLCDNGAVPTHWMLPLPPAMDAWPKKAGRQGVSQGAPPVNKATIQATWSDGTSCKWVTRPDGDLCADVNKFADWLGKIAAEIRQIESTMPLPVLPSPVAPQEPV